MMMSDQERAAQNQMQQSGAMSGGLDQYVRVLPLQTIEKVITIRFVQHGYNVIVSGSSAEQNGIHAFESPSNLIMFIDKLVKQERS